MLLAAVIVLQLLEYIVLMLAEKCRITVCVTVDDFNRMKLKVY
jgi:hypothetical protein